MTLDELLNLVSSNKAPGLCADSRLVKAGDIFVAVKGTICNGHDFINQALAGGAKYIVCQRLQGSHKSRAAGCEIITVENSAEAAALLAQASRAKTKLFSSLPPDATAVLNKQSSEAKLVAEQTPAKILWFAVNEPADLTAHIESTDITGSVFVLEHAGQSTIVRTPLLGRYNVSNHLAAAGLCLAAGFDLETVATGLSALKAIPGRLEKVYWNGNFSVFIDYAHTDDALKNVLVTLKPFCKAKLTVVFGCGGDRDRTKRPRMASVAEQWADSVIVTSDNPRTEKPDDIINEIVAGFEKGPAIPRTQLRATNDERRATKIIEPDRRKAIELAIETADKDDIVLIAGKGHETYQIIGTQKSDFSDKDIAQECLH